MSTNHPPKTARRSGLQRSAHMGFSWSLCLSLCLSLSVACDDGDADPAETPDAMGQMPDGGAPMPDMSAPDADQPDADPGGDPDAAAPDAGPAPLPEVVWRACPLIEGPNLPPDNPMAECADIEMPVNWAEPEGETLTVFVKRLPAPLESLGQLWLLNGGPGGTAHTFERTAQPMANALLRYDIYMADARGAGRSSRLTCPGEAEDSPGGAVITEEEWPDCLEAVQAEWGATLPNFDSTTAARDILSAVERTVEPDMAVFMFGVSYGTYWVHRMLQLDPDAFDGVILDSITDMGEPDLHLIDGWHDLMGDRIWEACAEHPTCREKLGPEPRMAVEALFASLSDGHCSDLVAEESGLEVRAVIRRMFGNAISHRILRAFMPAMAYRAIRCDPEDIEALVQMAGIFFGVEGQEPSPGAVQFGQILSRHVTLTELWGTPPPLEDLLEVTEAALVSKDISIAFAPLYEDWPTYALDEHHGQWAETDAPMLMMNGTLDPQTPEFVAQAAADHFTGPHQTYVLFPGVTHSVLGQSTMTGGGTCGLDLLVQFIRDPEAELNTACVEDLLPLDFDEVQRLSRNLFGTADLWEN